MKSILVIGARGMPNAVGGVEKHAERLFPRVAARGWDVTLIGLQPSTNLENYADVRLLSAPSVRLFGTDMLFYYVWAFITALKMRPDIVHLSGLGAAFLIWAYRLIGCKIVVRYGAADCLPPKWGALGRSAFHMAEYQLRWADRVIAVTPKLARRLEKSGISQNVHIVGNGLDSSSDHPPRSQPPVAKEYILFVGTVTRQMNLDSLISAFFLFNKSHPDVKLVIAGGWDSIAYRRKIEALAGDKITVVGSKPRIELADYFRNARLFINPSVHECDSNALLEAVGFNCPILLSDIPENRALRLNAKHLFDPHNVESIVRALNRGYANPDSFRVGKEQFPDWDEITDQTIQIYRSMFGDLSPTESKPCKPSRI